MDNEIMPFWWRLWIKDTQVIEDNDYACKVTTNSTSYYDKSSNNKTKTILKKDSMICHFAVYNGKTYTQ
jgi:uncharacterized protein (DUF2344 family)